MFWFRLFAFELELEVGRELDWGSDTGLGGVSGVGGNEKVGCLNSWLLR